MTIVCAIDGSRHSQWTLDWLQRIHAHRTGSLLLVHAVDLTQFKTFSTLNRKSRSALVKVLDISLEAAARLLENAELKTAKRWDHVRAKLLRGLPAEAITRSAKRERADLLVMGSRGVTEFQPMLLGSVSRKVLLQAPCPVLLVKKPARALKRIVVGTDGSIESWKAVAWLQQLPETIRPTVTVASVIPPLPLEGVRVPAGAVAVGDQVEGMLRREVQQLVSRVAGTLRRAGFSVKEMVMAGHPGAELVKLARRERTDLVVVGSRSGRSAREYFMGSIADTVVKYAPCSVLVHRG
jgi:nucleotide-binding universal stress UspA family protein